MKQAILILAFVALAACGGRGQKKVVESDISPLGEYDEMVTEYENTYNADSLLVEVTERYYAIVGDMKLPGGGSLYEYEYCKLPDGAAEQRKFKIGGGARVLIAVNITSPRREEAVELWGGDTTRYELKLFDTERRLVAEERHSKMNATELGAAIDYYSQTGYEYDALGREVKRTVHRIVSDDETRFTVETVYRSGTDKVVSERMLSDGESTTRYHSEHSGDTLVRKAYRDDNTLERIEKSLADYMSTTFYYDGTPETMNEVFTDGDRRIEVDHDFVRGKCDSTYYEGDCTVRMFLDMETLRTVHQYEYDSRGNPTRERRQAWFYEEQ